MELKYKWAADYAPELPEVRAKQTVKLMSNYTANNIFFQTPPSLSSMVLLKTLNPIQIML